MENEERKMTTRATLYWIKANLSSYISQALKPDLIYTEDWIAGIVMRETGILIMKYAPTGLAKDMHSIMLGDYSKRSGEKEKSYHGFGYTQIDIGSYPAFVKSGWWKQPEKLFPFTIEVLEEKRKTLQRLMPGISGHELFHRAITASYNCGAGNVVKAINKGKDIDYFTYNQDYSVEVFRFRELYKSL